MHLQISESLNLEQENQSRVTTLEHELRTALEASAQYKFDLDNLRREQRSTEDQLCIVRELNERLQENLLTFEEAGKTFQTSQADFRKEIERSNSALHQAEAALDSERATRQTLEQNLAQALRDQRAAEQKSALELAELRSALEIAKVERSRSHEEILRSRAECLATINDSGLRSNRLRANFTCVLQHINGTTRELLQSPLTEEQKYVIEALLQDVISLETTLDQETSPAESAPTEG